MIVIYIIKMQIMPIWMLKLINRLASKRLLNILPKQ